MRSSECSIIVPALRGRCGAYEVVPEDDYNVAQKVKSGQLRIGEEGRLSQCATRRPNREECGSLQIYRSGFRTWRLDTATGRTCILLTTDDDWKKPDITLSAVR